MSPYLSSNDESKNIENNGEVIKKSKVQKHLGVYIDCELRFDTCEKLGKNLLALFGVIKFMFTNQAQL